VAAANGSGSYTFDPAGIASGTYHVSGYLYNPATTKATISQLAATITIDNGQSTPQSTSFVLSGPTSGTYTAGQNVTVTWTATNVPAGGVISLCLDQDLQWMNGNERWIEIDQVAAANGNGSYTFDPAGIASGTYYVGGYLYNPATTKAAISQLTQPVTIGTASAPASSGNQKNSSQLPTILGTVLGKSTVAETETEDTGPAESGEEVFIPEITPTRSAGLSAVDEAMQEQDSWLGQTLQLLKHKIGV
ncbi:MAG: hypothetical protein JXB10_02970, partial [Pirellulales bacterium]|nr:hypothetical protein [Pirellulales bacterium]